MTDWNKFEDKAGGIPPAAAKAGLTCEVCEGMCLDAVDGTLTPAEHAAFERHVSGCVVCAEQLAEAQRGAAWMDMLKGHAPEPPVALLSKILAQTSGATTPALERATATGAVTAAAFVPEPVSVFVPDYTPVGGYKPTFAARMRTKASTMFSFAGGGMYFQPRLAMTAAMAFFSIALTMNLTGVRPGDLKPSSLHRTVADVTANASRSIQSMKLVNQFESRVSELRGSEVGSSDRDPGGPFVDGSGKPSDSPKQEAPKNNEPAQQDDKQSTPQGTSELVMPGAAGFERISSSSSDVNTAYRTNATVRKGA